MHVCLSFLFSLTFLEGRFFFFKCLINMLDFRKWEYLRQSFSKNDTHTV